MPLHEAQRKRSGCSCFCASFDLQPRCRRHSKFGDCVYFTEGFEELIVRCVLCITWTGEQWYKLRSARTYQSRRCALLSDNSRISVVNSAAAMSSANFVDTSKPKAVKSAVSSSDISVAKAKYSVPAITTSSELSVATVPAVKSSVKSKSSSTVSKSSVVALPPVSVHNVPIDVPEFNATPLISQDQFVRMM
jgi:hypothetical protein